MVLIKQKLVLASQMFHKLVQFDFILIIFQLVDYRRSVITSGQYSADHLSHGDDVILFTSENIFDAGIIIRIELVAIDLDRIFASRTVCLETQQFLIQLYLKLLELVEQQIDFIFVAIGRFMSSLIGIAFEVCCCTQLLA